METRISSKKSAIKTAVDKKIPLEKSSKNNTHLDHVIRGLARDFQKFQSLNNIYTNFSKVSFDIEIELNLLARVFRDKEEILKKLPKAFSTFSSLILPESYSSLSDVNKNLFNLLALEVLSNPPPSPLKKTGVTLERSGVIAQAIETTREGGTRSAMRSVADADKLKPFPFTLRLTNETLKKIESVGVVGVAQQRLNSTLKYHMNRKVQFLISLEIKDDNPHFHGSALISENEISAFKLSLRKFNKGTKSKESKFLQNEISYKKELKSRENGLNMRGYAQNAIYFHSYISKQSQTLKNCYMKPDNIFVKKLRKLENIHNHIDGSMFYASKEIEVTARKIYSQFLKIFKETKSAQAMRSIARDQLKQAEAEFEMSQKEVEEILSVNSSPEEIKPREEEIKSQLIYFKSKVYQEIRAGKKREKDFIALMGFTVKDVAKHYGVY